MWCLMASRDNRNGVKRRTMLQVTSAFQITFRKKNMRNFEKAKKYPKNNQN